MALDLWQIRRQKRMTIDELARRAEIHPGLIKAYELGERAVSASDLERLASSSTSFLPRLARTWPRLLRWFFWRSAFRACATWSNIRLSFCSPADRRC